jgi:hypothetical protein
MLIYFNHQSFPASLGHLESFLSQLNTHFINEYYILHFPLTCRITSSYLSSLSSMGYWPLLSACRRWCWARNWWMRSVRDWPPAPPGATAAWLDAEDVEPSRRWWEWWTPTGKGPPGSELALVPTCSWRLLEIWFMHHEKETWQNTALNLCNSEIN